MPAAHLFRSRADIGEEQRIECAVNGQQHEGRKYEAPLSRQQINRPVTDNPAENDRQHQCPVIADAVGDDADRHADRNIDQCRCEDQRRIEPVAQSQFGDADDRLVGRRRGPRKTEQDDGDHARPDDRIAHGDQQRGRHEGAKSAEGERLDETRPETRGRVYNLRSSERTGWRWGETRNRGRRGRSAAAGAGFPASRYPD